MIKTQPRFDFAKANGTQVLKEEQRPLWVCIACLSLGVMVGFSSGWWFTKGDVLQGKDISDETMERIRLGIDNIRLQRELDEQRAKEVVQ